MASELSGSRANGRTPRLPRAPEPVYHARILVPPMNTLRLGRSLGSLCLLGVVCLPACGRDSILSPAADGGWDGRIGGYDGPFGEGGVLDAPADAGDVPADGDLADLTVELRPAMGPPLPVGRSMRWLAVVAVGPSLRDLTFDPLLTFRTDNPRVATVSARGSEVRGVSPGETILRAQHPTFGTAEAVVRVTATPVARIDVAPSAVRLALGGHQQLVARAVYTDDSQADITEAAQWSTTDQRVVRVGTGLTPAGGLQAVTPGMVTVTAQFAGARREIPVTVGGGGDSDLLISPMNLAQPLGEIARFQAIWRQPGGLVADVSSSAFWSVGNESIAGPLGNGRFRCQSLATTIVRAAYMNQEAEATLRCGMGEPSPVSELRLLSANGPMWVGVSYQLAVTALFADGTPPLDLTGNREVTYSVSDPQVASLSPTGILLGLSPGMVGVSATYRGAVAMQGYVLVAR